MNDRNANLFFNNNANILTYVSVKQTYGDRILPDARQDKGGKGCTAYVGGAMYIR